MIHRTHTEHTYMRKLKWFVCTHSQSFHLISQPWWNEELVSSCIIILNEMGIPQHTLQWHYLNTWCDENRSQKHMKHILTVHTLKSIYEYIIQWVHLLIHAHYFILVMLNSYIWYVWAGALLDHVL